MVIRRRSPKKGIVGRAGIFLILFAAAVFSQGVAPVTDINTGSSSASPSYLAVYDTHLYFRANNLPNGSNPELWRYDGTKAELAAEIRPGPEGSLPSYLIPYNGKLYFSASAGTGPPQLWQFEGTAASQAPGWENQAQNPEEFFVYNGLLYFRAFRSNIGIELWKFDGATQTPLDLFQGQGSSYPQHFIEYNGRMYFNACAAPNSGTELYRLNPDGYSVTRATSIWWPDGSSPENLCLFKNAIYGSAYNPDQGGRELWRYRENDPNPTKLEADINPGRESSNPSGLIVYRDVLYFCADDGVAGAELWRYDGTAAEMVANINPTPFVPGIDPVHHSWPSDFFIHDDILYFTAADGIHGRELWSYDGAEVRLFADIYPGPYGSEVDDYAVFQGRLYFTANDGQTGDELGAIKVYKLIRSVTPPALFTRGDANADGQMDISDAVVLLLHLFAGRPAPSCSKSADVNDDGELEIGDAIHALSYLFLTGETPAPPFGACGADTTPDALACASYPRCE
ncbi:MAG: hypothetical protein HY717_10950 [Planctomycetes bacterium]|nr:hypothetical protein [Planctomycetota bacterium]